MPNNQEFVFDPDICRHVTALYLSFVQEDPLPSRWIRDTRGRVHRMKPRKNAEPIFNRNGVWCFQRCGADGNVSDVPIVINEYMVKTVYKEWIDYANVGGDVDQLIQDFQEQYEAARQEDIRQIVRWLRNAHLDKKQVPRANLRVPLQGIQDQSENQRPAINARVIARPARPAPPRLVPTRDRPQHRIPPPAKQRPYPERQNIPARNEDSRPASNGAMARTVDGARLSPKERAEKKMKATPTKPIKNTFFQRGKPKKSRAKAVKNRDGDPLMNPEGASSLLWDLTPLNTTQKQKPEFDFTALLAKEENYVPKGNLNGNNAKEPANIISNSGHASFKIQRGRQDSNLANTINPPESIKPKEYVTKEYARPRVWLMPKEYIKLKEIVRPKENTNPRENPKPKENAKCKENLGYARPRPDLPRQRTPPKHEPRVLPTHNPTNNALGSASGSSLNRTKNNTKTNTKA